MINHWHVSSVGCIRIAFVLTTLYLVGCAAKIPPPTEQMSFTQAAIVQAEHAGARTYAPEILRAAELKYSLAEEAISSQNFVKARMYAEKAEVDAQLAEAKARTAKTQKAVRELKIGIRKLRGEVVMPEEQ